MHLWNYLVNNYVVHSVLFKPLNHQLMLSVLCAKDQSQVQTLYSVHQNTLMSLASLRVKCTQSSCSEYVRLDQLKKHQLSCEQSTQINATPIQRTLQGVLQKPLDQIPDTTEKRVASNVIQRMVNSTCQQASEDFVSLKTGGRVSKTYQLDNP